MQKTPSTAPEFGTKQAASSDSAMPATQGNSTITNVPNAGSYGALANPAVGDMKTVTKVAGGSSKSNSGNTGPAKNLGKFGDHVTSCHK